MLKLRHLLTEITTIVIITNDLPTFTYHTMSRLQSLYLKTVLRQIITAGKVGVEAHLSAGVCKYSKISNWGSKKSTSTSHVKLVYYPVNMADPQVEQILAPLRAAVKKQVSMIKYSPLLKYVH